MAKTEQGPEKRKKTVTEEQAESFMDQLEEPLRLKTDQALQEAKDAVQTLAEWAISEEDLVAEDAIETIRTVIGELDRRLSEQLNLIVHHDDFQRLEGAWRGLHHLVSNTQTGEDLKIRVLNASKDELRKQFKKYKGAAWDQSPIFKKIYDREYDMPGGEPYGCLIGDYYFDHSPTDLEVLKGIGRIASAAHAPFISASSPELFQLESWQELNKPRDLSKVFQMKEYAPWRSFRESEDSRYVALTMPRFLARMPYGADTEPVEEFNFEEETGAGDHEKYTWANSAYAMGTNMTRAYNRHGWCAAIRGKESGGQVEGLPCHTFPTDDGGQDMKCPTEIAITGRREKELSDLGLMPLCHYKNTDYAVFFGAQMVHEPKEFDDPDATANEELSARLPNLMAVSRFAHYLRRMVRDKIGSFKERSDMERWLNDWIQNYVLTDPENAPEEARAKYPLREAEVEVQPVEGDPGYYNAQFYLRPHYQLEGVNVSLRLASKMPSIKEE